MEESPSFIYNSPSPFTTSSSSSLLCDSDRGYGGGDQDLSSCATMATHVYICLTSIPHRIVDPLFCLHLEYLLESDVFQGGEEGAGIGSDPDIRVQILLSIPTCYRRFVVSSDLKAQYQGVLDRLSDEYPTQLRIIETEIDDGPATKYMGPLSLYMKGELFQQKSSVSSVLPSLPPPIFIIIDDDHYYHPRMASYYHTFFRRHPDIPFVTGNKMMYFYGPSLFSPEGVRVFHQFRQEVEEEEEEEETATKGDNKKISRHSSSFWLPNPKGYLCGFMSFAIRGSDDLLRGLWRYSRFVLDHYSEARLHDEGVLVNFVHAFACPVYFLQLPMADRIDREMARALCEETSDMQSTRKRIEQHIRHLTLTTHRQELNDLLAPLVVQNYSARWLVGG